MIFLNHMKSAKAAKEYYTQHIAPGDYYSKDGAEMPGTWDGKGAERLGLSGEVKKEDIFALFENRDPKTGKQLTPRTKEERRVMTDVTFDVPKSVTLAYELGGDERILDAFQKSVRETMSEIETSVQTRVRKGGADENRTTGNIVWTENTHRTTRPVEGQPDPQLHAHAVILNATFDETEKRWKAIQLGDIVRDKGYYQAAFHSRLAGKLKDLGYGIEKDGNSFAIAGISRDTVEEFSRRSKIINAEAERLGIADENAKSKLGRKTREKKSPKPKTVAELREEWKSRITPETLLSIETARNGWDKGNSKITPEQAKEYALEHSFQNASAVSEKRLKQEALAYAVGSVRPEDVADISQHPEVIAETRRGQLMTTTKTVLNHEVAFLQFAKDGQRKQQPFITAREQSGLFQSKSADYSRSGISEHLTGLSNEQKKAALHILNSRDTVTGVVGKAGTGKTRMMRSTVDAIESTGKQVFVFAPSSQASRGVLKNEGFADANTLESLLRNDKLQQQTKGQVLWVDEAGLISSGDMRRLMDVAKKNGNRVILSGDYTQHSSVEAGDAFRLLEKEAGVKLARLIEIRRQTEPGYKKAVEQISEGTGKSAQKGFDCLDKMGSVIEASGDERHHMLVKDYLQAHDDGTSALIIAPTHSEGQKLTEELRGALKERGVLGKEKEFKVRRSLGWTDAQKGDARNYEPGMVVDFHEAVAGKRRRVDGERVTEGGFEKGEAVAVVGSDGDSIKVMHKNGTQGFLPMEQAERFQVSRARDIALARGDRIRITRNGEAKLEGQAKGTKINNGDIFTVEGFTKDGDIRLEKGKILPKNWGHFDHGYVDTSYASQGKTTDRIFISVGDESISAANQQQWYVSASRGREQARIYVDSKEDVRNAIARTGERLSAVELTGTKLRESWKTRFYKSLERNRVAKFVKERAKSVAESWNQRRREGLGYA
jgi:conjugative relaxase-like TrwC/TraI family protein